MKVVLMRRRPRPGANFSVELIVESLLENLSQDVQAVDSVSRFESNGVLRRFYNIVEAALRQGEVNHVTGDVNFLTYFLRRERTVLTILDCGRLVRGNDFRTKLVKLFWFDIPVRRCSAVTVISNHVKTQLLEYVRMDPDRIHVIPVAVPTQYRSIPREFNAERPVILQIGTAPNKNLNRLFQALKGIPCRLEIVGNLSDEHRRGLQENEIEFGSQSGLTNAQMLELYSRCDVVAFASTFEGFGMPIIEGNLVGRPVVTGNVTSMPEVAGNAACIVDPFDVASIREGLLRVIRDREYREKLVANGFENAKRYDVKTIVGQYEDLYRRIQVTA